VPRNFASDLPHDVSLVVVIARGRMKQGAESMAVAFKYDIAFSFLARDEDLVVSLADRLRDRFIVFVFTERQKELAGRDGEDLLSRVFGVESRVVVVMHRSDWGNSPWTRVEKDAIKNRAFDDATGGYDFTLFVPLDGPASLPPWLPKTQIWLDFHRHGVEGAAVIVAAKAQTAGAIARMETAVERAQRYERLANHNRERSNFLRSPEGTQAARREVLLLQEHLLRIAKQIVPREGGELSPTEVVPLRCEPTSTQLQLFDVCLDVNWPSGNQHVLEHSVLRADFWRMRPDRICREHLMRREYSFDIAEMDRRGWRETTLERRFFSTSDLADKLIKLLLDHAYRHPVESDDV